MGRLPHLEYKWLVAIAFLFGLFMDLMDTTIVNVAIPSLSREFNANTSAVEWTITGYLLSLAVVIPAAGWLSDRFGTKRIFLMAMAIFIAGSAACGQAHSLPELITFRFLQGIGGGMMTPVGTAMLSREFPGEERARASAIISIPVVLAPTVGPVIGGYLTEYVSWRWIFYVNVPVGIMGFIFSMRVLEEHKEEYAQRGFDMPGLLLGSGGAASLLYSLSQAGTKSWTSPDVMWFGLAGVAMFAAFTVVELRVANPILDLRLFKRWLFTSGNLMMAPAFAAFGGFLLILTLFLQELQGYSPLQAGLIQAPSSLGTAISLPLASRLYPTMGPRKMLMFGFFAAGLTILPFMTLQLDTPVWVTIIFLFFRGIPFAFAAVASQTIIYGPLESEKQGPASSIYNTLRQVAASFGVALIVTITISRTRAHESAAVASQHLSAPTAAIAKHAAVMGYHEAFLAVALMLGLPFVLAFFIDDRQASANMRRRAPEVVPVE